MAGWKIHHEWADVFSIENWGFSSLSFVSSAGGVIVGYQLVVKKHNHLCQNPHDWKYGSTQKDNIA